MAYTGIDPLTPEVDTLGSAAAKWAGVFSLGFFYDSNKKIYYNSTSGQWEIHDGTNSEGIARVITQAGAPASAPVKKGSISIDESAEDVYISVDTASASDWVKMSVGIADFDDLNDTPANKTGAGYKLVAVNSGATALEYVTAINTDLTFAVDKKIAFVDTNSYVRQTATAFQIGTDAADFFLINSLLNGKISARVSGSGGTYYPIIIDPSDMSLTIDDEFILQLGYTTNPLKLYYQATGDSGFYIENAVQEIYVIQNAVTKPILFKCKDGGGTLRDTLTLDTGSNNPRVGIGETSPSYILHIKETGSDGILAVERDSGAIVALEAEASLTKMGSISDHQVSIVVNDIESIRLDADADTDFDTDDVHLTGLTSGYGILIVRETVDGASGIYRLENQTIVVVSQNAAFSTTKDTASKYNIYWETDQFKIQNKVGDNKSIAWSYRGLN